MSDREKALVEAMMGTRPEVAERRRLAQIEKLDKEIRRLQKMRDRLAGDDQT